jgi:hypothetical protein
MEKSVADEIAQVSMGRPHVVLLGAGASRAAFPTGERSGRRLPLMLDFAEIVPVGAIFAEARIQLEGRNFEDAYAELALAAERTSLRDAVERAVLDYFASLRLPDSPTLYDHLVLSLRPKDVIATINWDPFLIQAVMRNGHVGGYPRLLFLHGNVLQGYCESDNLYGRRGARCSKCGEELRPVRLLYPIREKDYETDRAVSSAWDAVKAAFAKAFMVTIFGYSAPQSDRGAVELLRVAWGGAQKRPLEQFEIIDVKDEEPLVESWKEFIHTNHYEIHTHFYDSWIANHPRRTGEAYWNQYMEAAFIDNNPVARPNTLQELWQWFAPLIAAERAANGERGTARP